jgi:hypothetical protein
MSQLGLYCIILHKPETMVVNLQLLPLQRAPFRNYAGKTSVKFMIAYALYSFVYKVKI